MKDQISALMDDELDVESSEHLFKALASNHELDACWSTYHLVGDVMRGETLLRPDFQARLMQRLESEPTVLSPKRRILPKPSFVLSAAASLAAVLFVGWMVMLQQIQSPLESLEQPAAIAQNNVSPESMNEYLLAHHELSPEGGMQPAYYVRSVAYEASGN